MKHLLTVLFAVSALIAGCGREHDAQDRGPELRDIPARPADGAPPAPAASSAAPGVADASYFAKWDRVVDLMAAKGIWMQFDMHQDQWHETYGGEGVPNWAMQRPALFASTPVAKVPFPGSTGNGSVSVPFLPYQAARPLIEKNCMLCGRKPRSM